MPRFSYSMLLEDDKFPNQFPLQGLQSQGTGTIYYVPMSKNCPFFAKLTRQVGSTNLWWSLFEQINNSSLVNKSLRRTGLPFGWKFFIADLEHARCTMHIYNMFVDVVFLTQVNAHGVLFSMRCLARIYWVKISPNNGVKSTFRLQCLRQGGLIFPPSSLSIPRDEVTKKTLL